MFNPYAEWLGLPTDLTEPDHFQLLELDPKSTKPEAAAVAADRALAKVRACRPGEHSKAWADLLDQIRDAKKKLGDAASLEAYQRELQSAYLQPPTRSPGTPVTKSQDPGTPSDKASSASQESSSHRESLDRPSQRKDSAKPLVGAGASASTSPSSASKSSTSNSSATPASTAPASTAPASTAPASTAPASPAPASNKAPSGSTSSSMPPSNAPPAAALPSAALPSAAMTSIVPVAADPDKPAPITAAPVNEKPASTAPNSETASAVSEPVADKAVEPVVEASLASATPQSSKPDPMAPVALPIAKLTKPGTSTTANTVGAAAIAQPVATAAPPATATAPVLTPASQPASEQGSQVTPASVSSELVIVEETGSGGHGAMIRRGVIGLVVSALAMIGGYFVLDYAGVFDRQIDDPIADGSDVTATSGDAQNGGADANANQGGQNDDHQDDSSNDDSTDSNNTDGNDSTDSTGTNQPPDDQDGNDSNIDDRNNDANDNLTPDDAGPDNVGPDDADPDDADPDDADPDDMSNDGNTVEISEPDGATILQFGDNLAAVQQLLFEREIEEARQLLDESMAMNVRPSDLAMGRRLGLMVDALDTFWASVEAQCESFRGGEEIMISDDITVSIVEYNAPVLVYHFGENIRESLSELKAGLAMKIAEIALEGAGSDSRIVRGAFYAIERLRDPTRRDRAIAVWEEAALFGGDAEDLIAYLDDDYDLAASLIEQMDPPDADAIEIAQASVQDDYADEIGAARNNSARRELALTLITDAAKADDSARRYALFLMAADLAARAGDAPLGLDAIERLAQWFNIDDLVPLQAENLILASKSNSNADDSKEVARSCMELAESASSPAEIEWVEPLMQAALLASRRSRDRDFQDSIRVRVDELRAQFDSDSD